MNMIRRLMLLVGILFMSLSSADAATAPPSVQEVLPATGPAAGGTAVVIVGSNLSAATQVKFGSADAQIFFINSDSQISAISPAGSGTVDVVVINSAGSSTTSAATRFTYEQAAVALSPAAGALPGATVGQSYSQQFTVVGGSSSYSYALAAGSLPPGLSLTSGGILVGTATAAGSFNFSVKAAAADGSSLTSSYSLAVAAPTIVITPNTLPAGAIGQAYNETISATGGTGPYSYSIVTGSLPAGLGLSPSGQLGGTPRAAGTFNFTVSARDSSTGAGAPFSSVRSYSLSIAAPTIVISPSTLPNATGGAAYSQALTASGGTAGYTFSVTAGSLPPGMRLTTGGVLSGTPSVTGTFNFTVTATDSSTGTGPFSGSQAYSIKVLLPKVPSPPIINNPRLGDALIYANIVVSGYSDPGTTVRIYIDGSLAGSVTADSFRSWLFTPNATLNDGSHTVVATATDAFGQSSYSETISYTIDTVDPVAPVVLSPANGSVLTPGSISVSGTSEANVFVRVRLEDGVIGVTYRALSDSAGRWTFVSPTLRAGTYRISAVAEDFAGNLSQISNVNSVTLASPPTAQNASLVVPYNTATQIDLASSISGSYTSITATGSGNGVLTISGSVVTYTPLSDFYGTDRFTYTAVGIGGTSAPATVAVTVAPPAAPTATDVSGVEVPYGSAGTVIDLGKSINGVYDSVTLVALPAHGSVAITGNVATYTPASTYYGADSFSFVATGPGGSSAPAAVSLTVATPAAPVVASPAAVTVAGATSAGSTSAAIDLSPTVSGVSSGFELVSAPAHGTATLAGNVVTYIPTVGFAGADSFTFQAVGPGGNSNLGTVAITVQPTAAVAQARTAAAADGETITVDLTAGATGGPFTGAAIVSVSPAASSAVSIVEGGTAGNRTYAASIKVADHFNGLLQVRYTLSNAFGPSAEATITVNVTARPNPSADPAVRALSEMQAESTLRFAQSQTSNFMRRMESMHGGNNPGPASTGLRLTFPHLRDPGFAPLQRQELLEKKMIAHFRANGDNTPARADRSSPTRDAAPAGRQNGSIGAWTGGTIEFGTQDLAGNDRVEISSSGVSLGADIKLADGIVVGLGGGFGWDRRDASGGSNLRGKNTVAVGYASFAPRSDLFVDALFGIGSVDFKTRRPIAGMAGEAAANRGGSLNMGSLAFGIDTGDKLEWSLYGRAEWLSAKLDAYVETGAGTLSLRYDERQIGSLGGVLGGRIGASVPLRGVVMKPRVRAEWRHEFQDLPVQMLDYANVAGPSTFGINGSNWASDRLDASIGSAFHWPDAWILDFELGVKTDGRGRTGAIRMEVSKQF